MLNTKFKQSLRAKAHQLKPVVLIGNNGLTPAVLLEINRALEDHELIKVRIATNDRAERMAAIEAICTDQQAELVQVIGNIGVIYRKRAES